MVRARLADGSFTSSKKRIFGEPVFVTLRLRRRPGTTPPRRKRTPWVKPYCPTYEFPCHFTEGPRTIIYRPAEPEDLKPICKFVDFWLSGGAKRLGIPVGGADYFVPYQQQRDYISKKIVYIATYNSQIIGWAVKSQNNSLIHLLIHGDYRGKGLGGRLLHILDPETVRSKSDQSTGDPLSFYRKHGYEILEAHQGEKKNIDILKKNE